MFAAFKPIAECNVLPFILRAATPVIDVTTTLSIPFD